MALIVEDGSGVESANTYVATADIDTYCSDLGLTAWAAGTTPEKEAANLRAMQYIESLSYKGIKSNSDYSLKFPRYDIWTEDGYLIDSDEIPNDLKKAVCRAAYEEIVSLGILQSNLTRSDFTKREKVSSIEMEYDKFHYETVFRTIKGLLKDLVESKTRLIRT